MINNLNQIKDIRKKLGITQIELAKKADVSQSMIAKIESGRLEPTYSHAMKIFDVLESLEYEKEKTAEDIMVKNIISVKPDFEIKKIIETMKKYEISQMPVIENHKLIGVISERTILESFLSGEHAAKASQVMQDAPPTIGKNTPVRIISNLLSNYPLIIVNDKGKLIGIITKSDLIRKAY
ncbi:CBS domain-containing protein [Candidatus Woesearchaeota archaeon]|nr:CBS domain-containing protein [Candidatus Woesearchaeota archaeon]